MAERKEDNNEPTTTTTSSNFNLLEMMAMRQVPAIEELINRICTDFDLEEKKDEMFERYINKSKKDCKKLFNKFRKKNSRQKSGYTIFLSDPVIIEQIKNENKDVMMKNLNPIKGKRWKSLDKKVINRYDLVAQLFNHNLIETSGDKTDIQTIIKTWVYEKELSEINNMLKDVPEKEKTEKKEKKEKKKKEKKEKKEKLKKKELKKKEEKKPVLKTKVKTILVDSDSEDDSEDSESESMDLTRTVVI